MSNTRLPLQYLAQRLKRFNHRVRLRLTPTEDVFTRIYDKNAWNGRTSRSGIGSDPDQTKELIKTLPKVITKYNIKTLIDAPCGDFAWMQHIDLNNIQYTGIDIVDDVIKSNKILFTSPNIRFEKANILTSLISQYDMILCRDCLVHFSYADIQIALKNLGRSGSRYLLMTNYPHCPNNKDIITGEWRQLNFQIEPFNLKPPLESFIEGCTEKNDPLSDKCLSLWDLGELTIGRLST